MKEKKRDKRTKKKKKKGELMTTWNREERKNGMKGKGKENKWDFNNLDI